MTYDPNIPQPTDLISQSQSQIQTNFAQANTAFGIDHTAFDTVANQGKHKKSTYYEQAVDPTTLINEMAVYTKDVSTITQLFVRRASNGTVIQLTAGDPTASNEGQSFLPGGIIIKWGNNVTVSNGALYTYATGAFPTATFMVVISPDPANTNQSTINDFAYVRQNPGPSGFTCTTVRRTSTAAIPDCVVNYIAIGN